MSFTNIWENNGLYRVFTGITSGKEVVESNLSLHGDPRFDNLRYVLNDFSGITNFHVSELDLSLIAGVDNAASLSNARLKIAIVAIHESLLDWVHLYCEKMKNSPYKTQIFTSVDDALQWCSA